MEFTVLQYVGIVVVVVGAVLVFSGGNRQVKGIVIEIAGLVIFKLGQA